MEKVIQEHKQHKKRHKTMSIDVSSWYTLYNYQTIFLVELKLNQTMIIQVDQLLNQNNVR